MALLSIAITIVFTTLTPRDGRNPRPPLQARDETNRTFHTHMRLRLRLAGERHSKREEAVALCLCSCLVGPCREGKEVA